MPCLQLVSSIFVHIVKAIGLQPVKLILTGVGFSMALSGMMVVIMSSADRAKVDFIAKWIAGNIWGQTGLLYGLFYLGFLS